MPRTWGGFFKDNAVAVGGVVIGGAKTCIDNYWLLTKLPLAGQATSDITTKAIYFTALLLVNTVTTGAIGCGIDYVRKINKATEPEDKELINNMEYGNY